MPHKPETVLLSKLQRMREEQEAHQARMAELKHSLKLVLLTELNRLHEEKDIIHARIREIETKMILLMDVPKQVDASNPVLDKVYGVSASTSGGATAQVVEIKNLPRHEKVETPSKFAIKSFA